MNYNYFLDYPNTKDKVITFCIKLPTSLRYQIAREATRQGRTFSQLAMLYILKGMEAGK